jgi:hypothetical protein
VEGCGSIYKDATMFLKSVIWLPIYSYGWSQKNKRDGYFNFTLIIYPSGSNMEIKGT